jgi:dienelactone hydrolase
MLKDENASPSSPVYGKIGTYGVMGYSMGGGASVQAASDLGSSATTCVGLAPYSGSPGRGHTAATLIIVGSRDSIAPPSMADRTFDDLPSSIDRCYAEVRGENHLFWTNQSFPGDADNFIGAWLKYYLEGDSSYYSTLDNPPSGITSVVFCPDGNCQGFGGCGN